VDARGDFVDEHRRREGRSGPESGQVDGISIAISAWSDAMSPAEVPGSGKVLIVDDEAAISYSMRRFLTASGYHVDVASTLAEAEERLAAAGYGLVIVDLRLSSSDDLQGLDLLRSLRRDNPRTRTMVLSAYGSPELEEAARECGACCFLHKPQPLSEIARLVGVWMHGKET
jgi:two-component system response regulator PilR (NtrC family)